jgi:hypothetical protein
MANYIQPGLLDRFNNAQQHTGPTMLFDHEIPGSGGQTDKVAVSLDSNYGVRTAIKGLPAVSGSAMRNFDFNPHQPPREVDLRHVHESPGGLPFSLDHKEGISRSMLAAKERNARTYGSGSIGILGSSLISGSHETAETLKYPEHQVRAKTPPYARGTRQKIGQNRYNVTEYRPGVGTRNIAAHIDKSRLKTDLAPKISLNTVSEQAFVVATDAAREEGSQMREFMRASRPDMIYYNQDTIDSSRQQMLSTVQKNDVEFNSEKNKNKNELLSSHLVKDVLEKHHPVQDMLYQHHNNSTMRRTAYGGKPKWDIAPHVDAVSKGWNGQRGQNISTKKPNIAPKLPMQSPRMGNAYARDTRVRGKITAVSDANVRPNGGNMTLDRDAANGVAGIEGNYQSHVQDQQLYEARKARMMAGSGNPITGSLPVNYKIPTFRDIELLNHERYG